MSSNTQITKKGEQTLPVVSKEARQYVEESTSENTRKAYASDLRIFAKWCGNNNCSPLPAEASNVANFLASQADTGLGASTLNRRLAAIRYAHKAKGFPSPTDDILVTATLKGIRRTQKRPVKKKTAATIDRMHRLLAQVDRESISGKRDHALLLLGFSGAFRRSELASLELSDIEFNENGLTVTFRQSKTDQNALGQTIAIPNGKLEIIDVLRRWLTVSGITEGAVFRKVSKSGKVGRYALADKSVALIVKKYAAKAGLDVDDFAGHSLRSGFTTSAAEAGANLFKIMDVTRHKSVDTVREYVSSANAFKDHAGDSFL